MDLMPGESVIWEGHPTWRSMISFHMKGIAIALLAVALLLLIDWLGADFGTPLIVGIAAVIIGVTILAAWVMRFFTKYAISDKRLHISKGVLSKTESSTNVDRIQNITTFQSAFDRVLRCGTLDFDTAGETEGDTFVFAGVNDPQALREKIMRVRFQDEPAGSQGGLG